MSLVKQQFYGFYSLVNIHSYFIRTVQVKYWGNNRDIFESDTAHIGSPGRPWGAARIPSFYLEHEGCLYLVLSKTTGKGRGRSNSGPVCRRETDVTLPYWTEPAL